MKSKFFKQFICILLVVVFLIQLIPAYALPVGDTEVPEAQEAPETAVSDGLPIADDNNTAAPEKVTVTGELNDLREETVKQFRLSDGSFAAMEYSVPVHYKTADNRWEEIDNTLKPNKIGGETVYTANAGDVTKHFTESVGSDGKLFDIEYKDHSVSVSLDTSSVKPEAPEDESLSVVAEEAEEDRDIFVQAIISNPSEKAEELFFTGKTTDELGLPEKYSSAVTYEKVLPNTDLVYTSFGYNVKENIVVHQKQEEYSYKFVLELGDLTPIKAENGDLLLNDGDETVFEIPAPYITDNAGAWSAAASYSLTESEDGYILTVEADKEWMNASDREFPVTIDPQIYLHYNKSDLMTAYIREDVPTGTSPSYGDIKCGSYDGYGECDLCVQVYSLPDVPKNCVITSAQMQIVHAGLFSSSFGHGTGGSVTVDVFKVNGGINDLLSVTWNTVFGTNGLGRDQRVLDYKVLNESTLSSYVSWDVTPAALEWYQTQAETDPENSSGNDTAKGTLVFVPENASTLRYFANLIGHAWYENSPYFIVQYRDTVGVESYYTYRTVSAARAGEIYIGDFTSQITLMNNDISMSTDAVSADVSHVYNMAYANALFTGSNDAVGMHTCDYSGMKIGKGWKLSVQQTVVPVTLNDEQYLIYSDGDGTEHYFFRTATNTFEDEDGLSLKIVRSVSGGNTVYTMTDADQNNTRVFHNGYLISITDSNGNAQYIAYNNSYSPNSTSWKPPTGSTNKITQIVLVPQNGDAITAASFAYSGGRLASVTDVIGRVTSFAYDANDCLTSITYPDGVTVYYQYDGDGYITKAYDGESQYGLTFTYWDEDNAIRLNKVTEFTAANVNGAQTVGVAFHGYAVSPQLKQYRYYGEDHSSDTSDDIVDCFVFDNSGRTICEYQTDYLKEKVIGASTASYKQNSGTAKTNNRLTETGALGIENPVLYIDSGFENSSSVTGGNTHTDIYNSTGVTDKKVRTGHKSLHFNSNSTGIVSQGGFNVHLDANTEYTLSCYVNSSATNSWTDSSYGRLTVKSSSANNTALFASEKYNFKTTGNIDKGWERISYTFTPTTGGTYYLGIEVGGFTGDYYADDFQIEKSKTATSLNLLLNGNPTSDANWYYSGGSYTTEATTKFGSGVFSIAGASDRNIAISQNVYINDSEPGTFILSGWGKAEAVGSSEITYDGVKPYFGMLAAVVYEGSSGEEWHFVPFNSDCTDWQYASGIVAPKQDDPVELIRVYLIYCNNCNTAYFDNISLVREPVQTYTYDDKGNPVSAKDGGAKTDCKYKTGTSLMTEYTEATGVKMNFTYEDNTNNLLTASVPNSFDGSVVTTNTYTNGLLTQSVTTNTTDSTQQTSSSVYDGGTAHRYGLLTQTTDANGITTSYGYDSAMRPTSATSTVGGGPVTQFTDYCGGSDRVADYYIENIAAQFNVYSNGMLSDIVRKSYDEYGVTSSGAHWQSYHMAYDSFGNMLSLSVNNRNNSGNAQSPASRTLVTYSYNYSEGNRPDDYVPVDNGLLKEMTYANGSRITYIYDELDRVIEERYTDGVSYNYVYSSDGSLSEQNVKNASGNVTERYNYDYDSLGRLIRSRETLNGVFAQRTEHLYDSADRLTSQTWYNGGGATTLAYGYGEEYGLLNRLSIYLPGNTFAGSTPPSPSEYISYAYTGLNQLRSKTTYTGGSAKFTRAYSYTELTGGNTSNFVEYMNYRKILDDSTPLIYGNRYEYDASGNISAVYDSSTGSRLWEYTYDSMNQLIRAVHGSDTYEYTYDTAGNIRGEKINNVPTKSYTYDDDAWADQLTAYNGYSITYDNSGNPTSYHNGARWTFSWTKGRQLATASSSGTSASYTYDISGVRNGKTVNDTVYKYNTLSGHVMRQEWDGKSIDFIYDDSNQPYAMRYRSSAYATPTTYYFVLNLQGDVVALMDSSASIVARYEYDPWGAVTVKNPNGTVNTSSTFIGNINPLRYRGYYYDTETGFYYLQSRYYDPEIGRFINADTFATTDITDLLSSNMFAYCENNPVNHSDPTGEFLLSAMAGGALLGGVTNAIITCVMSGGKVSKGEFMGAFVSGAIGGALTFTGAGIVGVSAVNALAGMAGTAVEKLVDNKRITKNDCGEIVKNGLIGAATAVISGKGVLKDKNVIRCAGDYDKYVYKVKNMNDAALFDKACADYSVALSKSMKWGVVRSFAGSLVGNILSRLSKS